MLPVLVFLLAYRHMGIHPFGDKSILVMDMDSQYINFYAYMRRVLTEGEGLVYSWTKGMGGNMLGLIAFYLSSPFTLLIALFPKENITDAVLFIELLKLGLCGVTFSIFFRYQFKRGGLTAILFSMTYALMSYTMAYSLCVKWLDAVLWLPVILIGVEKLLRDNKYLLFVISYAIMLFSNFYTCYMITIFVAAYFTYRYVCLNKTFEWRVYFKKLLPLIGCGLFCVCLCGVLILPTFDALFLGKVGNANYVAPGFFNTNIAQLPKRLFIGQYDSLTNSGVPSIFCGTLVTILCVYYFFNRSIPKRERIASGWMLAFFGVSFCVKAVDMVWHTFAYPNWFPYRYAFTFCFFVIYLAARSFLKIKWMKRNFKLLLSGGLLSVMMAAAAWLVATDAVLPHINLVVLTFVMVVLFTAVLIIGWETRITGHLFCGMLILLSGFELLTNCFASIQGLDKQFRYQDYNRYSTTMQTVDRLTERIEQIDNSPFYRIDTPNQRTDNDSSYVGYRGVTHYSSFFNRGLNTFTQRMGLSQEYFKCRYNGANLPMDDFLGVKYIYSKKPLNDLYEPVLKEGDYTVYQNPNALSVGFMAKETASNAIAPSDDYLDNQSQFFENVTGREFYERISIQRLTKGTESLCEFIVPDDRPIYFACSDRLSYIADTITLYVDGQLIRYPYADDYKRMIYIGRFRPGQMVTVRVQCSSKAKMFFYTFNEAAFQEATAAMNQLSVEVLEHTRVTGTITATEEEPLLFTTIPYDKGWKLLVDGKDTEVMKLQDAFIGAKLSPGEHEITLIYHAPLLRIGMCLTVGALLVLAVAVPAVWYRRRLKQQ